MTVIRKLEQLILYLVESSIEDTRALDVIAAYAGKHAGKSVTRADAKQLEAQLRVPVRIRRQHGMTLIVWGTGAEAQSILLAYALSGVRWPSSHELRATACFFEHAARNRARQRLLDEHREQETQTAPASCLSMISRTAAAIIKAREALAEVEVLIEFGAPMACVRWDVKKLIEEVKPDMSHADDGVQP